MPNRLQHEKSPYLLQHVGNPVDWYPWSDEALDRARREDKPLLVSIGYSACHWCHVMAHESFEDESVAAFMNDRFINVKVDREERPDVDAIYMEAVQALSGHGGWPLNVFLVPDGRPFFGGTYFPPEPRHGLPSWRQVLESVDSAYVERREDVLHNASVLTEAIRRAQTVGERADQFDHSVLQRALEVTLAAADWQNGGFGGAPKFPQPLALEFILRMVAATGDESARRLLQLSLTRMMDGGLFDQLGGGFHRYTVDSSWIVPHFEKMLYDNALLARLYLYGFQATRDERYRRVTTDTLDYLLREMRDEAGGFYSAMDADSEGIEGKFYVWTPEDLDSLFAAPTSRIAALLYGVRPGGNFEGATVLTRAKSAEEIGGVLGIDPRTVAAACDDIRHTMFTARALRVPPGKDTKIVLSWNALTIRALAEGGRVLERPDYIDAAEAAAVFILEEMSSTVGLVRSYRNGASGVPAFLEDYAYLVEALLALSETVPSTDYLQRARDVADEMLGRFWDADRRVFFDAEEIDIALVVRPRNVLDNPIPAGSSSAAHGLLRLAALTGEERYREIANTVIGGSVGIAERAPLALGYLLCALELTLHPSVQVALVTDGDDARATEFVRALFEEYRPHVVRSIGAPGTSPLLEGRTRLGGQPTAHVCEHFSCQIPTTSVELLRHQLQAASPLSRTETDATGSTPT